MGNLMTSMDSYIYIDIAGAERDKREIDKAVKEIDEALKIIKPSNLDTGVFQGVTYDLAFDEYTSMRKQLEAQRQECVDLRNRITNIVQHFLNLDREIRRKISEIMGGK